MYKNADIQDKIYSQLIESKISPIIARYLSMRFQNMKSKSILSVLEQKDNEYLITTDLKKYIVTLPSLPIPDANIKELKA